jgi:drug/metabolite transporter (DMT)-like permease
MIMWAVGFPAAEILLQSWGAVSLVLVRQILSVGALLICWIIADGWVRVLNAPWRRGISVGSIGFGFGAILLLVGQKMSDPVTPAIAAAMMPIAGAAIEVVLDGRRLRPPLLLGILLALVGGYLATGATLADSTFGFGAVLCVIAVILFAWATRATTRNFSTLSPLGQTTVTLVGGMIFMCLAYIVSIGTGYQEAALGELEFRHVVLLLIFSFASLALAQLLWIWAAGGLGILLASFHMNAVPFYVMVTVVVFLNGEWDWRQAIGATFVATGVIISQLAYRK